MKKMKNKRKTEEVYAAQESTMQGIEGSFRIARYLAHAGLCSREKAAEFVRQGKVMRSGEVLSLNTYVRLGEDIEVNGRLMRLEAPRLWLYHKPRGLIVTHQDEKGRKTIFDALAPQFRTLKPIGRLDVQSEGLLLLTNWGAFVNHFTSPAQGYRRCYHVRVFGRVGDALLGRLNNPKGLRCDGFYYRPLVVKVLSALPGGKKGSRAANTWLEVALIEGKNREIRKIFTFMGLRINRLKRVSFGPFSLDTLRVGEICTSALCDKVAHSLLHKKTQEVT